MKKPNVSKKGSYVVEVEEGKKYFWCSCGLSQNQPFCDGSHKTTGFSTIPYTATKTGKVFFVDAKIVLRNHYVMVVTINYKNNFI